MFERYTSTTYRYILIFDRYISTKDRYIDIFLGT